MWHLFRTIKGFMLLAALAGSLLLFAGAYGVVASLYDRTVREDAREVSEVLAGQTFDAMFQVMRKGWTRAELEEFLAAMRGRFADTPYSLEIYRGERVEALYGAIEQPLPDAAIRQAFADGRNVVHEDDAGLRHVYPLRARQECLGCHTNAAVGDTLGVIDLRQDLRPVLERARAGFMAALWLIVPVMLAGAFLVAMFIHGRIDHSVQLLRGRVGQVNKVSDLAHFAMDDSQVGFRELDDILGEVRALVERLREFAVDKDLLEFEIRLLERFIITSEVVRDWREYVNHLLLEINKVMEAYVLFSVFKVEEEVFDLEIFWRNRPSPHMTQVLERSVRAVLQRHPYFKGMASVEVNHNTADASRDMPNLSEADIELQSKSLFVDTPKIGGIVGIGVQAGLGKDAMRLLVMESILSTLLNVVGSVKAIYKYTKELEYYATRDPLTHLYNQRAFWELLEYEMDRARRKGERLGLLMIDMDNFKSVNDTYGHGFGDAFLQAFANLLKQVFRHGDVVARYGGDEFVVLLTDTPENQAWTAAQRLVEEAAQMSLTAPDGKAVRATISIGIALCPDHAEAARDLFLIADNLMYRAKSEGKNRVMLAGSEDVAEIYRGIGAQSFTILAALEEKRFVPYFQPIVAAGDGTPFAFEVLSRMLGESGEVAVAGEYIDVAERMGVVHKLDYQVMEHAFEAVRRTGYTGKLFVNLSPKALILGEFMPTVERLVEQSGIDPAQVVFELTERETVRNLALLQTFVTELKARGFQFAIDDFGSGFSSFHYLKHFPIDYVKIDGDFIINLMHDERDQVFVRHMAAMARDLGIQTIAEFVEDAEVMIHVREAGVGYVQGYFIGRPGAKLG
ncbi:putative bifunctional diguanylate cyclase/phosphodiesterase [Sulfurivermis fontis]|uniref:putative bifunctional diguanylate cyclase/phosphodiesterase n=1 Tax=Sulfurivermis fontis TaxID=1972068 RepID=UPI000FDA8CA5|nr:bifunctional diguanylate cyclase/phosphodiesterase [Sulfurivermis fontis]